MSKSPRPSIFSGGDITMLSLVKEESPVPSQAITQAATTPKHQREASRRRTIFTNDQEVFVDTQMPLILLSDTNLGLHFPGATALSRVVSTKGSYMRNVESTSQPSQHQTPSKKLEPLDVSEHSHSDAFKTPKSMPQLKKETSEKGSQGTSGMKESSHANEDLDIFNGNRIEIIEEMNPRKLFVKIILNSKAYNAIYTFLILYALFADDLRQILLDKRADRVFDVFTFICLFAFSLEICLFLYIDKAYRWSLFFFLDVISTASFIINLSFLSSTLLPAGTTNAAQLARASRASRIGTRAGRIVRLVRMFRMTKVFEFLKLKKKKNDDINKVFPTNSSQQSEIIRLDNSARINLEGSLNPTPRHSVFDFNMSSGRLPRSPCLRNNGRSSLFQRQNSLERTHDIMLNKPADDNAMTPFRRARTMLQKVNEKENEEEEHELKESRVGKKLSDLTTKRVVVIVLLMLVLLPMFSTTFFFEENASDSYELSLLGKLLNDNSVAQPTKDKALEKYIERESNANPKLILLTWGKAVKYRDPDVNIERLRWDEQNKNTVKTSKGDLVSITNLRPDSVLESQLSLGRNFFVIVVLATAALLFSKDANNLVLRPIERMIEKVNMIARNPLIAKNQQLVGDVNDGFENETVQIENAIVKIGGLLALGYGDAGSMIITKNVAESGDLNPMLAGRKIAAIFGFCDIRNFTDATEVLQEGVMVFVNSIAEIVHSTVDKYCGAANKNIGDAFLLAWKLPEDDLLEYEDGTLMINPSKTVTNLADLSLLSFLKINAKINKDPTLLEYRDNPSLCARLPKYKVKMGFGLHLGWAIEGAIGSQFKIDASYLSPNVNLASRLEAATKQYGVPLLFSGDLYQRLSKKVQQKTRLIDIVTVKGSVQPMEIYTCDMDVNDLIAGRDRRKMAKREREDKHYQQKELFEDMLYYGETSQILEMDKEIQHLLRHQDPIFNELFTLGFNGYVDGDWTVAKKKFEECLAIKNDDGPTRNLMAFLAESDFISPEDWKGFRVLTDK